MMTSTSNQNLNATYVSITDEITTTPQPSKCRAHLTKYKQYYIYGSMLLSVLFFIMAYIFKSVAAMLTVFGLIIFIFSCCFYAI